MSNTDINAPESEPAAPPQSQPSSSYERHGVDLAETFRDERFSRRSEQDLGDAKTAASELIEKRKRDRIEDERRQVDSYTNEIVLQTDEGIQADRHASAKQSDARRLAEELTDYRERQKALAAEYLQQQYGTAEDEQQGADGAPNNQNYQQPTDEQAQAYQAAVNQRAEELARQHVQQYEAQVQPQLEQQFEQTKQISAAYAAQIQQERVAFEQLVTGEFSDIQTYQDEANLARTDPNRYEQYLARRAQYADIKNKQQQIEQSQAQLAQHEQQQRQQQWNNTCADEDAAYLAGHPELKEDPRKHEVINREAMAMLRDEGLNDQQIWAMYTMHPSELAVQWPGLPSIRSRVAQNIIHGFVEQRLGARRMQEINSKRVPPASRTLHPGVRPPDGWRDDEKIRSLESRLDSKGSATAAAELLRARRAAARGRSR